MTGPPSLPVVAARPPRARIGSAPVHALLASLALLLAVLALADAGLETGVAAQPVSGTHDEPRPNTPSSSQPGSRSSRQTAPTSASTRAQLQSVRVQINRMKQQATLEARERDRLTGQLRDVELAREKSGDELDRINGQIADSSARRAATATQEAQQDRALSAARARLVAATRAAYMLGHGSPLEQWLDQRNPLEAARLLRYYGYYGRASAGHITRLQADVRALGGLADKLTQEQAELATLKQNQEQTLQQLAHQRDQRQQLLQQLTASARTRTQRLASLNSEQADLERVLKSLSRSGLAHAARPGAPEDLNSAFARQRGQLLWPVNGQLAAAFGQERASGVTWDGMVISTQRDNPVHAISAGRIVYADWLPGMGLLVVLDHGDGYLSLYGHNDRLFKAVGAQVSAGEVIAAAGDTGGRADPELYFEIRRAGRPIDPRPWFKSPQPAP